MEEVVEEVYYSGCNALGNHGDFKDRPVGTATALHDCGDCMHLAYCKLKQKQAVFPMNEEIKKQMNKDWKEMIEKENKEKESSI